MLGLYGLRHLIAGQAGWDFCKGSPAGLRRLSGSTLNQYRNHHECEAARLRLLLANATTPALKARLLEEVEKLDQLAKEGC
jgi:hypothetical protein